MGMQRDDDAEDPPNPGSDGITGGDRGLAARRLETCRRLIEQERVIDRTVARWLSANADLAMLLELYAAERDEREVYLWQLCHAVTIPVATAHRKLGRLIKIGLAVRTSVAADRRRIGMRLTPCGIGVIEGLLDRLGS